MSDPIENILTKEQKDLIFENMSDGVIMVDENGEITYANTACSRIFHRSVKQLMGESFEKTFLQNKKNLAFNRLFRSSMDKCQVLEKRTVRYQSGEHDISYLSIDISLIRPDGLHHSDPGSFSGMLVLIEDVTDARLRKQHEHDYAYTFAGLVFCIFIYLATWSLCRFTLHMPLGTKHYTLMIEGITFLLFLAITFLTSFSPKDVGIIPNFSRLQKNCRETLYTGAIVSVATVLTKVILGLAGIRIKGYFIGGSLHGAVVYAFTALAQEFLARGVIQTSIKSLMRVRYQKQFGILLTSLLFSLMHLPFGFYFMMGAFALSIALGVIYERQKDIWGCYILHWGCGYLAMCLFF